MEYFSPPRQLVTDTDTLLLDAVQFSNSRFVLEGIINGDNYVNINTRNSNRETALMLATKRNNIEFVDVLLKNKNTSLTLQDINGDTALHIAIRNYYYDVAKLLLLDWRTDINSYNKNSETVVHLVCNRGDVELFKLLESYRDLDVTMRDILGYTPFMYCIFKPNRYIINKLLEYNVVVEVPNILDDIGYSWEYFINNKRFNINGYIKEGQTLFSYSCYSKDIQLLRTLYNSEKFIPDNVIDNINIALKGNNIQFILELLKNTYSYLDKDKIKHLFIYIYDENNLIILLDYLLSVNILYIDAIVFYSIIYKRLYVLEQYLLCLHKNVQDLNGNTILNLAIQHNIPISVVKKILKIGTDPNIANTIDKKPLYYAIEEKNSDYIELLLPITSLLIEERIYLLELREYIRSDILVDIVPLDCLEMMETKYYIYLIELIGKLDKTSRKQILLKLLETPERYINLLVKLANISLKDSHNTEDICTLEEFNVSNSTIVQYGKKIEGKYRTITLDTLVHLVVSLEDGYIVDIKDPFDRSNLYNKLVHTTCLPIFLDCIVRHLIN
jgi:serine/threonine-protein phosphatase 6 regulatory ankyrin repeat subunit B